MYTYNYVYILYNIYQTLLAPINTLWGFAGIRLGQQAVFGNNGTGNGNGNGTILLAPIGNAGVVRERQITQLSYHYFSCETARIFAKTGSGHKDQRKPEINKGVVCLRRLLLVYIHIIQ
jgi:hypothetical protein